MPAASLNPQQKIAVSSDAQKILCLAGAGTGKTFCMIERIARIVEEGTDPSSILVLTFTNAAAFEMKERYKRRTSSGKIPEFRTFHSFCYNLLSQDREIRTMLGYSSIPNIADEQTIKNINVTAAMQMGIHLPQEVLSGKKRKALSPKETRDLEFVYKAAERIMKQRNLITFDRLCYGVCDLFVKNAACIKRYQERFKYIFVDEFQDTDERQWSFIQTFKDAHLFVVGDALQAIYSFRGADSTIIQNLSKNPEWFTVRLSQNYRSTKNICEYANKFGSSYADDVYRVSIESERDGPVVLESAFSARDAFDVISLTSMKLVLKDLQLNKEKAAIIVRTNKEVAAICEQLDKAGIKYLKGHRNTEAIHTLRSVLENQYLVDYLAATLNAEIYPQYIRLSTIAKNNEEDYGIEQFMKDFGNVESVKRFVQRVMNIRNYFRNPQATDWEKANHAATLLGLNIELDFEATHEMKAKEIVQKLLDELEGESDSSLYVGTIHSVKGLEYDTVYVMDVGCNSFKLKDEENKNLFYVAVTRARTNLFVFMQKG